VHQALVAGIPASFDEGFCECFRIGGAAKISIKEWKVMPALPTLNVLHRAEFPSNYATVMVLIENVDGAPRHTHPGLEMTYILEGEFKLMVDGRPDQALKPGDWFEVPAEVPHSVENVGGKPGRALAHYVVEASKPLTTWL
jgi:quercetin dioxygenase-like cupin family protein